MGDTKERRRRGPLVSYGHIEPAAVRGKRFLEVGEGFFAIVDAEEYEMVRPYRWFLDRNGEPTTQFKKPDQSNSSIRLKSMILMVRVEKGHAIKYLDGNPLNCSRSNLKLMTLSEARVLDREHLGPREPRTWTVKKKVSDFLKIEKEPRQRRFKLAD